MKKILVASLMLAPFIIGCSSTYSKFPRAEIYPTTYQKKMQAANHWDELAKIEAKNTIDKLPIASSSIYINKSYASNNGEQSLSGSPFKKAFRELITSQLVQQGANVVVDPYNKSIVINYDVQVLTHKDRGYQRPVVGTFSLVAANIAMVWDAQYWGTPGLVAIPLIAEAEWLNAQKDTKESPVEVIITTKAVDGNTIVMSDSKIYYVNVGDADHYVDNYKDTSVRRFKVVSH